jgi:hypothetical protein
MPTQHGKYRCLVKEGTSIPFFTFEPLGEELREIEGKVLSHRIAAGHDIRASAGSCART